MTQRKTKNRRSETNETEFHAVCHDCGTVVDETFDNKICQCGGIFHVDSARCLSCSKRHPFSKVGEKCSCGGEIVPKMVSCPSCKTNMTLEHIGEYCPNCNILLKMK